jgi:hypothetical protein
LALRVAILVTTVAAIAVGAATKTELKTITIELDTLRLLAVATWASRGGLGTLFISHEEPTSLLIGPKCRDLLRLDALFQA